MEILSLTEQHEIYPAEVNPTSAFSLVPQGEDLSQMFGGLYTQPTTKYTKAEPQEVKRLTAVQRELFEQDPSNFAARQQYFEQMPKPLADYFGKRYQQNLNRYGSQEAINWLQREMKAKLPRMKAVMSQYCDVFALLEMPFEEVGDLDRLHRLYEELEQAQGEESLEECQQRVARNVEKYQELMPDLVTRLTKGRAIFHKQNLRPLCFMREDQIQTLADSIAFSLFEFGEEYTKNKMAQATDSETAFDLLLEVYLEQIKLCDQMLVEAPHRKKALRGKIKPNELKTGLLKLACSKFWKRKLNTMAKRMKEHLAIAMGKVHALSPYVSIERLREFEQHRQAMLEWLKSCILINIANEDEQAELIDIFYKSSSHDKIKRTELLLTTNGSELIADEMGLEGLFITLTAPSKYHAMLSTGGINPKWNGSSPRQTQAYLMRTWAKIKAELDRKGILYNGLRVVEPHADATPHWHLMLFIEPAKARELKRIFWHYALEEDGNEKGAKRHRCTFKKIDKSKGTATGYLVKYLAKNIDGLDLKEFMSDEGNLTGKENAMRVKAWASTWGIRQFARLGNAQIGLWRELRRLGDLPQEDEFIDTLRMIADLGDWAAFVQYLGGALIKRKDLAVRLSYIERAENGYLEKSKKVVGIENKTNGKVVKTRLKDWVISRKPRDWEERKKAELAQKEKERAEQQAKSSTEVRDFHELLGELARPWTCVSNCTSSENEQLSPQARERLKSELITMRGRVTDYQIDELLSGKRLKIWSDEQSQVFVRFVRGRLIEEKIFS